MEIDEKDVNTLSKTNSLITYGITLDSTGNYLFKTTYDKINIYSKSGETETRANSDNAFITGDPIERMLGLLKKANIVAIISPTGEVREIQGYDELGDQIINAFDVNDIHGRAIAQSKWDQVIGEGLIKKNMDQLFKIFPDSAVHLHDNWKLTSRQEGEIDLIVNGNFTLKAINEDIAIITAEGKITGDNSQKNTLGYDGVTTKLSGDHQGEFEVERKTGMLMGATIKSNVKGTIQTMGREIPVTIISTIKINGHKK
jgi:hypothetical protein